MNTKMTITSSVERTFWHQDAAPTSFTFRGRAVPVGVSAPYGGTTIATKPASSTQHASGTGNTVRGGAVSQREQGIDLPPPTRALLV